MNKILRCLLTMLFIAFQVIIIYAQPGDPGGGPTGGDPPVGGSGVPLDGGALELLLAGLTIMVFKKARTWYKGIK
jgi:hypothetical protein